MLDRFRVCVSATLIWSILGCSRSHTGVVPQATVASPILPPTSAGSSGPVRVGEPSLILTTGAMPFMRKDLITTPVGSTPDVTVDVTKTLQTISGFGGAFNEQGWEALSTLNPALKSLFDSVNGLRFNMARSPIGASDYAIDRYTLDETAAKR